MLGTNLVLMGLLLNISLSTYSVVSEICLGSVVKTVATVVVAIVIEEFKRQPSIVRDDGNVTTTLLINEPNPSQQLNPVAIRRPNNPPCLYKI